MWVIGDLRITRLHGGHWPSPLPDFKVRTKSFQRVGKPPGYCSPALHTYITQMAKPQDKPRADDCHAQKARNASVSIGWERLRNLLLFSLRHKMVMVMLGGAVGTYLRFCLGRWFSGQPWAQGFPYATFVINVSGSFILGIVAVLLLERLPSEHQDWYLLIGTGFCGGYTTFSTFEWETFKLVRDGSWGLALVNIVASVAAGFVGLLLGVALVHTIFPPR